MPSDKSISHRALIVNALAHGEGVIELRSPGGDVLSTVAALRALGVPVERLMPSAIDEQLVPFRVSGLGSADEIGRLEGGAADCHNSGTTLRLLAGAAASGSAAVRLTGDRSLRRRPMERVAAPLRAMGAIVTTREGRPPLEVEGRRPLRPGHFALAQSSAQVLAAVSLAALAADGSTTIHVPGPTRDHTERILSSLGARVRREEERDGRSTTTIDGPAVLAARSMRVPGDPSSAAAWLVVAALRPGSEIRILGVSLNPSRLGVVEALREMGAWITISPTGVLGGEPVGDIVVRGEDALRPLTIAGPRTAALVDDLPLLAVAMAAASGVSEVRDAAELRVKESDRIETITRSLRAVGARVEERPDGWLIRRGRPGDARIETAGDHRVAMSMAVAAWAGVAQSVTLDDPGCVAISYPTFWADAAALGADHPATS